MILAPSFQRYKALNPAEDRDLADLVEYISTGAEIPERFYRPGVGGSDQLLQEYGILHLHLGSRTSDTLLFLMQFTDRVVLLETNTHQRFRRGCEQFILSHRLVPVPKPIVVTKKRPRLSRPKG